MQFHLFLSNTYENAFLQVIDKLNKESNNVKVKKHFFVVPDRITLNAEKIIFEKLDIESTFNIEVITLSKLASRVLNSALNDKKVLTKQSGIMLTTKVILNNKQKLKAFQKATHFSGFVESVYETIMQLKSCNIKADEFLNSANKDNISLKLKIEDLALIYKGYEEELEKGYLDASSKLSLLAQNIAASELIKNSNFYFALFDSFTPQQYSIIAKLIEYAKGVNIGICSNTLQNNAHIYPNDMYNELTELAKQFGMNLKDIIINDKEKLSPPFQHLLEHYGAYKKPIYLLQDNIVQLFKAKQIKEEVEFVASSILKNVYEKKERYNSISVAVSNMDTYKNVVEEVFNNYNIPYYLDKSTSLLEHHFTQFLMQAIQCVKSNFLNTDVLSYTKNHFANIAQIDQNLLEDAVLKFGINYSGFLKEFAFLDKETIKLEALRKSIVKDISFFNEKENTVSHYVQKIKEFFEFKNVKLKLDELEKTYEKTGNIVEQKRTSQVYDKVQKLLFELEELLGQEVVSIGKFYELLLQGLKATTLSTIPVGVDCVFVGEVANNNFIKNNVLFVLGANDGVLPKLKADVGIILEDELNKMNEKIVLEPSLTLLNKKAKFNLFQLFLTAQKQLIISYSIKDQKNAEQKPSSVIGEFQKLYYVKSEHKNEPLPIKTMEKLLKEKENNFLPFYYANPKVAFTKWLKQVKKTIKENEQPNEILNNLYHLLTKEFGEKQIVSYIKNSYEQEEFEKLTNADSLFFSASRTKVSQLESYFMCPFKHFLDYGLKLKEKERAGMKPLDVGIILHSVAEQFGALLKQNAKLGSLQQISNKLIDNILNESQYKMLKEQPEYKNLILSLKDESLRLVETIYNEQQNSNFKLNELEFSFGLNDKNNMLNFNINGRIISFSGIVDRVDTYDNYFRIIDYKTGKSDFSFKELYFGKKIQLFMYASVYKKLTGKTPAGVFYFPIKNEFEDENKTSKTLYKMEGAFLNSLAVIKAFDNTLSASKTKSGVVYLTVKTDKQENIIGLDQYSEKRAYTEEEFNKIEKYTIKLIETALAEILTGNITPSPLVESGSKICDFCPYKNTCPIFSSVKNYERPMKKVDQKFVTEASEV